MRVMNLYIYLYYDIMEMKRWKYRRRWSNISWTLVGLLMKLLVNLYEYYLSIIFWSIDILLFVWSVYILLKKWIHVMRLYIIKEVDLNFGCIFILK